jgi:hypothetical protein
VAFAPDGKTLASGGGHVTDCREMPDGRTVVTHTEDHTLRLWDAATGKELRRWDGFRSEVTAVAFAPDGKRLACVSADWDNRIFVHDLGSGKKIAECVGPQGWVSTPAFKSIAFSPDGKILASAGTWRHTLDLWDPATGKHLRDVTAAPGRGAHAVAFGPDGRMPASANDTDNKVVLWDRPTGEPRAYAVTPGAGVSALAFAADGRTLVTGGTDGSVRVWDVAGQPPDRRARLDTSSPEKLRAAWEELGDARPGPAYRAARALTADPGAVPFLREHLRQPTAEPQEIKRLIADLDSDDFPTRDRAARELERLGLAAAPALREALANRPSAEVRRQAERLLDLVREPSRSPRTHRALRAVEVLERVGTAEARAVLEELSKGTPDASPTQEATAALRRLGAAVSEWR